MNELINSIKEMDLKYVSEKSGVSYTTVRDLVKGRNTNPTHKTITKLKTFISKHSLSL